MRKIFFATGNQSKVERFREKLSKLGVQIISISDLGQNINVEENGKDAIENAIIKAKAYANFVNMPVVAMDDNLYIDDIPEDKQPGMYVRRVNGKRLTDEEMIDYYSKLAHDYGDQGKLTCRWVYGLAIINQGRVSTYSWSKEDFYIVDIPCNKRWPGYPLNSISVNKKLNKYFTDITEEDTVDLQDSEDDVVRFIYQNSK